MPYIRTTRTLRHRRIFDLLRSRTVVPWCSLTRAILLVRASIAAVYITYLPTYCFTAGSAPRVDMYICTWEGRSEGLVAPIDIWVFAKDFFSCVP
ncbi:uncharacterized protein SCHCODRAFT_02632007 [Schizophyllum commune H4-8]|uniref:uncharacterized protein n=1 Tax=Schizophyllum commune (strain H4-8 / FGSC 9210) TaxID=578458 RepID=UPI00215E1025|nr:uncharacterized protein SCHCODRAFT_02632007 [Schizophyllum commune H4-8]KAI5890493.1 hypothetical protein SCHCODRAFT_02632007 [Schizophyllum commune H4-8]